MVSEMKNNDLMNDQIIKMRFLYVKKKNTWRNLSNIEKNLLLQNDWYDLWQIVL